MASKMKSSIISKVRLQRYVHSRLNHIFHSFQVLNVITILFEEMFQDLKNRKEIKIHNLGTLQIQKTKPRLHCNITQGNKQILSKGSKKMTFLMSYRIKKRLRGLLDLDKTYGAH